MSQQPIYPMLLNWPQVSAVVGLKKQTIQGLVKQGDFPPPLALSPRIHRFDRDEVLGWLAGRYDSRVVRNG